jgi:hypothetical protein
MVFVESRKAADKELKNEGEDKLMETWNKLRWGLGGRNAKTSLQGSYLALVNCPQLKGLQDERSSKARRDIQKCKDRVKWVFFVALSWCNEKELEWQKITTIHLD